VHGEKPSDVDVVADLAELHLHALAVGELDAETLAAIDVLLRDLHAALRPAEPAHAMGQPRRAKPHLHDLQTVAEAAEHVVVMDFEAVELKLAMAAVLLGPMMPMRRTMRQPGWSLW